MNVVHLELPRIFTLTVKEYLVDAAAALEAGGHAFAQYDLNPCWWKFLLGLSTPHSPRDLFEPLIRAETGPELWLLLAEVRAHFLDIGKLYGVPLSMAGIHLEQRAKDSSYALCALVADNYGCALFSNFFRQLEERLHFLQADVISLGFENQEGMFWALQIASWLKSAGFRGHICIGRHAWENFSLLPHIDDLAKNAWFFSVISSVILYQEELAQTLRHLVEVLAGAPPAALHNIAIRIPGEDHVRVLPPSPENRAALRVSSPAYTIPPSYFAAMEVPASRLVYAMVMVRNKCFYKRCTFCVQIAKHISDHAYSESAEVPRALQACAELLRHGIRMFNFMDEAMRPVDIRAFCAGVRERGLNFHWVGRMIAAANPNRELLRVMKEAGCTEILFGLETFDPRLSADMGKVSKAHDNAAETSAMIECFLDAGLFVILSMIYEFPTELPASRRQTLESIEQLLGKTNRFAMIFNQFHLLSESQIYKDPAKFNIQRVEVRLPENDLQYYFAYECAVPHPPASAEELALMHRLRLGLGAAQYAALLRQVGKELLDMAFFLDYVSIGFQYRLEHDATLLAGAFSRSVDLPSSAVATSITPRPTTSTTSAPCLPDGRLL